MHIAHPQNPQCIVEVPANRKPKALCVIANPCHWQCCMLYLSPSVCLYNNPLFNWPRWSVLEYPASCWRKFFTVKRETKAILLFRNDRLFVALLIGEYNALWLSIVSCWSVPYSCGTPWPFAISKAKWLNGAVTQIENDALRCRGFLNGRWFSNALARSLNRKIDAYWQLAQRKFVVYSLNQGLGIIRCSQPAKSNIFCNALWIQWDLYVFAVAIISHLLHT